MGGHAGVVRGGDRGEGDGAPRVLAFLEAAIWDLVDFVASWGWVRPRVVPCL